MSERVILLIEDSDDDAFITRKKLGEQLGENFRLLRATTIADARQFITERNAGIEIILLDLRLPDTHDEEDTFRSIKEHCQKIPVVILTSTHDHHLAVKFVGEGAEDFINKEMLLERPELLRDAIDFAVSRHRLLADTNRQKDMIISWMSGDYSLQK
jgi:DNA-binding NtrC family response regulator